MKFTMVPKTNIYDIYRPYPTGFRWQCVLLLYIAVGSSLSATSQNQKLFKWCSNREISFCKRPDIKRHYIFCLPQRRKKQLTKLKTEENLGRKQTTADCF